MHRRQVLSAVGAVAAIGLVGCAGSDTPAAERNGNNSSGTGSGQPTGTTTPTATGTSTPARRIELESREFTVVDRESGQQRDDVRIGYQTEANEVRVEGTIWGSDGCKTARLDAATYDADENRLSVAVATRDRTDDAGVCTQALVEIDYEATFGFSNGTPDETTVSHDGREVARGTTAADAE
jgi:hypothetical protein